MLNTILLFVIALFAVFYFVNALTPESKKAYFKRRLRNITKEIWEKEFTFDKTMQIREGIRMDRDRLVDAKHNIEKAMKEKPKDKALEEDLKKYTDTIKRYEAQMGMLDAELNGVKAEGDNPGGQGINDTISSLAEVRRMVEDYITRL